MQSTISTQSVENGQISFRSRLMQNYRLALPVSGKSGLATCPTAGQDIELYSIGTNGAIYNIYRDPNSDTGWSATNLKFSISPNVPGHAAYVTAALNPDGSTTVWAVDSSNAQIVYYLQGGSSGSPDRWDDFNWQIVTDSCLDTLIIGGLQTVYDPSGNPYLAAYNSIGLPGSHSGAMLIKHIGWQSFSDGGYPYAPVFSWCTGLVEAAGGIGVSAGVFVSDLEGFNPVIEGISSQFGSGNWTPGAQANGLYTAISAAVGPRGFSEPFAISQQDQGLYYLVTTIDSDQLTPVKLSGKVPVKALAAGCGPHGLEVFGLSNAGYLYHTRFDGIGP
ncbi:MAG: hypothetical protein PHE55_18680, partial [Methylococcaceae bacterium]|nr:hypothetical protein [Methylococcaceae bacterium]